MKLIVCNIYISRALKVFPQPTNLQPEPIDDHPTTSNRVPIIDRKGWWAPK